ncbi:probable serine/threonine-protein kinase dyrk2 [Venturia canescens]|uniref:probable serine/threonine-protein kinase dyrk2 n=1 Tax=Venturia canescens TaxID=32260 RepID=UPI001C9D5E6E|nr:probable serine/threonine-protein kinase dyrk2 [Venturia canescens]
MTSCQRRGSGPVRQHSLQQMSRRHHHHHHHHHLHHHPHHLNSQMRRQRSAEEDRSYGIGERDSAETERPREVRIAWGTDEQGLAPVTRAENNNPATEGGRVEVVACQIVTGKSRALPNSRQPRIINRTSNNSGGNNNNNNNAGSTLLYSRQELAERLRLAWKQREANKSNIDVFLAQGTTEERSDSRLSNSSSPDPSSPTRLPERIDNTNEQKKMADKPSEKLVEKRSTEKTRVEKPVSPGPSVEAAKSKRASFRNGTNAAFSQPVVETPAATTPDIAQTRKEVPIQIATNDTKNRRTNSAPPQRRASSVGPSTNRTQVNIVIEAPRIFKPETENAGNNNAEDTRLNGIVARPVKSAPTKRRTKNPKKRSNSSAGKESEAAGRPKIGNAEGKNGEVITMVSLVSDADSDTEIEDNSPRDDKLISQLRSNLPTTPIIKSNVSTCCSLNSIVRRPIKSVSFQQDSIDVEDDSDKTRTARIRPQSVQVGRVTGSALPTAEEARTWRANVPALSVANVTAARQRYETQEISEISLTDREKRCLIVPIGDLRSDKKRKLLRTKSTPQPRIDDVDKPPTMQDTREAPPRTRIPEHVGKILPVHQPTSILLHASVSKLSEIAVISKTETEAEADDLDGESAEPTFQTTKEKECWHLYRRMCDKGVCVSFDTVLRGMLTPTEYRLRRKETS